MRQRTHGTTILGVRRNGKSVLSIGSGAPYATAAARAYLDGSKLGAAQVVKRSLDIAAELCIYTNSDIQILEL